MRMTLEELESRQIKCEGKVFEMMTNTREYAQLLEEAQDTIHNLRLESDMEGRGWSRAAIWDDKTGTDPSEEMYPEGSSTRKAVLDSQSRAEELREHKKKLAQQSQDSEVDPELDPGMWDGFAPGGDSLGLELERGLDSELARFGGDSDFDDHPRYSDASSIPPQLNTLSSELGMEEGSTFGDFASRNIAPATTTTATTTKDDHQASEDITELPPLSPSMNDIDDELSPDTIHISTSTSASSVSQFFIAVGSRTLAQLPHRLSLSAELHQQLEENNILQKVLTGASLPWSAEGQRSPDSIRAEVNRTLQHHLHLASAAAGSPRISRTGMSSSTGSASSSTIGLEARMGLHGSSGLASSGSSTSSLPGATNKVNASSSGASTSTANNRSRGSIVLENQSTLGLKYLLSATSSADLSNVITKTKAKGSTSSIASTSSTNSSVSSLMSDKKPPIISVSASSGTASSSASARRISSPSHMEPPVRARASSTSKPWATSMSFTASRPAPIKTTGANIRGVSPGRTSPGRISPGGRVSPVPRGSTASPGKASGNKSTPSPSNPAVTRRSSLPSLLGSPSSTTTSKPSKGRAA